MSAVFGNSLWLLPETKLSGLCADVVHLVFWLVHIESIRVSLGAGLQNTKHRFDGLENFTDISPRISSQ